MTMCLWFIPYDQDPKLTEMFSRTRALGTPRYGLSYIEQVDQVKPSSRFQNKVVDDSKRPSKLEMYNFFSLMKGCKKYQVDP